MKPLDKSFFVPLFLAIFGWSAAAFAQADFYKGKTITVYIGTTPGALDDQWGRILAMHMSKHIPGKPAVVVQNMPGEELEKIVKEVMNQPADIVARMRKLLGQ
jgi:tripartite-type tricarboxylate transporter receptor subunit TctC